MHMMSFTKKVLGALALSFVLVAPAMAQGHPVWFSVRSGGFNALTNLDAATATNFKKVGYNVGATAGMDLQRYVGVRVDFTVAQNQLRTGGVNTGNHLNRFFYDAAVQLQYPTAIGLEPYVLAGGGAVTLHQNGANVSNKTRGAGTFGLGVHYAIPGTGFGVFAEGQGWVYKASNLDGFLSGADKTQVELGWSGGISYRVTL
jgi:Outer membrane protein beta-barrel domain